MRTRPAASSRSSRRECGKFRTRVLMLISHMPLRTRKRGNTGTTPQLDFSQQGRSQRKSVRARPGREIAGIIDVASEAFGPDDTAADAGIPGKRLAPCKTVATKARRDRIPPA